MATASAGLADHVHLDKIDRLFALGAGGYLFLPQIVVVGDQSSGKSSVLAGLTKLPFPRDSGLCTRFATQITFRRAAEPSISVSIIPAPNASPEHAAAIKGWSKNDLKELDEETFASIITEVHTLMQLGDKHGAGGKGTFSEDVLKLEVAGPEQEHFSVVDVPGIFRKTTEGITTTADKAMVRSMVQRYMENPRSVILMVIPSNVDIATQEILTMAEEVDEDGHRSLGILTKPDLVDKGAEAAVMELLEGKKHKLNLGWCVVRNLGQRELDDPTSDRTNLELDFFRKTTPWNSLDEDRVGIDALRFRLQEILADVIRREFPKVKSDIHKELSAAKQARDDLGARRETTAEQTQFLLEISMRFQALARSALKADYVGNDWFDQRHTLRFATRVVERNDLFGQNMEHAGHSFDLTATVNDEVEYAETESQKPLSSRTTDDHPELEEVVFKSEMVDTEVQDEAHEWLTEVYQDSRGFELGTFDSSLLAMTMKTQSSRWEPFSQGYISDIINMSHSFIVDLLHLLCPDSVSRSLMSVMMEKLQAKYQSAIGQVQFLLHVERKGTPATMNHYFNDNLEKSRQERMRHAMNPKAFAIPGGKTLVVGLDEVVQNNPLTNTEHIVQEIMDILKAYYKVARKRFVDNMCMQAADYFLVGGPDTPLTLFSPKFVIDLSAEQLEEIAGEDSSVKRKRKLLTKKIQDLEAAKKVVT